MIDRAKDWFSQAQRDLEQAKESRASKRYEWACFASHQAAEKAVKALHLANGQEAWGHVIARLLRELPRAITVTEERIDKAHVLDSYYVAARYPNGHAEGAPFENIGKLQAEEAVRYASEIIEFASVQMAAS